MARKTDVSEEMSEVKTIGDEVPSEQPEQAEQGGQNAVEESRVWVYLGPSIRGVVTNGRIYFGSKAEIIESFGLPADRAAYCRRPQRCKGKKRPEGKARYIHPV